MTQKREKNRMNTKIKMLVMDVDGTLTDGKIYIGERGEIMKAFNVKDGYAIAHMCPEMGILPVIITGRKSQIVEMRAKELNITEFHQGVIDKAAVLEEIMLKTGRCFEEIAYIGDDINDLGCMLRCGLKGCPADAVSEVRREADYICNFRGGDGAVREFVEWIGKQ